jgi:hypothetical protein
MYEGAIIQDHWHEELVASQGVLLMLEQSNTLFVHPDIVLINAVALDNHKFY